MSADPSEPDIIERLAALGVIAVDNLANTTMLLAIGEQMHDNMDREPPPADIEELAREAAIELLVAAQHMAGALAYFERLAPLLNAKGAGGSMRH